MSSIIKLLNICKNYKKTCALNKVNLKLKEGDIYGLVGENGAGKTTIIRIISGLIFADTGDVEIMGFINNQIESNGVRKNIASIVETPALYLNMNAIENLKMQCMMNGLEYDLKKIKEKLFEFGLGDVVDDKKKVVNYSLGMKQRLSLCMAMVGNPKIIILDEPTNGLDPDGIREIRNLILRLNRTDGISFIISSHNLDELSKIATRYGFISKGEMVLEINRDQLEHELSKQTIVKLNSVAGIDDYLKKNGIEKFDVNYSENTIAFSNEYEIDMMTRLLLMQYKVMEIKTINENLEDFYFKIINRRIKD